MVTAKGKKRRSDGSVAALAARLGVSHVAVVKAKATGRLKGAIKEDGALDVDLAEQLWRENTHPADRRPKSARVSRNTDVETLREEAEAIGVDTGNLLTYNEAATLLKNYQAKLAELEYEQKSGKLIDQDDVAKEWFRGCRIARDAVMSVPDRLSAELAGITDPFVIQAKMTAELRVAIADIIKGLE